MPLVYEPAAPSSSSTPATAPATTATATAAADGVPSSSSAATGDATVVIGPSSTKAPYRVKRPQSSRLRAKINDTYSYFQKKVDPLVSVLVTTFLSQQPMDVLGAMRLYFANMRAEEVWQKASIGDVPCYEPLKNQKVYFTQDLGPVLSKVVDAVAASQPQNVMDFIIEEVLPTIVAPAPAPAADTSKSSAARSKLNDAIHLAGALGGDAAGVGVVGLAVATSPDPAKVAAMAATAATTHVVPSATSKAPTTSSAAVADAPEVGGAPTAAPTASITMQISMLGLGGGGKSSIIKALQGDFDPKIKPSLGFKPVSMQLRENASVTFFDLGGGKKIREIWENYHHDVHGVVYVFDASLSGDALAESVSYFQTTMTHEYLAGKPLLVLANKADVAGAATAEQLAEALGLAKYPGAEITACVSAIDTGSGQAAPFGDEAPEGSAAAVAAGLDPRLEAALERLLDTVQGSFAALDSRVKRDSEKKKVEEAKKRLARERKVLRNRIAMAFTDRIAPEKMPDNLPAAGADDTFTREEGIDFIAGEIGVDRAQLDPAAVEIIAMVGYQRLAMQIVGALKSPINKKKTPMEWAEIREMVVELRVELGLPELPDAPDV